jgi:hypothetical protein
VQHNHSGRPALPLNVSDERCTLRGAYRKERDDSWKLLGVIPS